MKDNLIKLEHEVLKKLLDGDHPILYDLLLHLATLNVTKRDLVELAF